MKKIWRERSVYTEEQIMKIEPNPEMDSIVLSCSEADKSNEFRLHLSYDEALALSKELEDFVNIMR